MWRPLIVGLAALLCVPSLQAPAQGAPMPAAKAGGCTIKPGTKCPNAHLKGAHLQGADLRGAHLQGADLRGANLKGADLRGAHLKGADLRGANLRNADVRGAGLKNTDLRRSVLREANLSGNNLRKAKLRNADLRDTALREAQLAGVAIPGARLTGANLGEADLHDAKLKNAKASGANLGKTDLDGADLTKADLRGTNLQGSSLRGARLTGANLSEAEFGKNQWQGSDITGAVFTNAAATTYVLPDDGSQIMSALNSAQHTIDIVIYEIGGPNIVGQPGAPGALMNAVSRGVDVRIIVNGQWWNSKCTATTSQSECAAGSEVWWIYATQASLLAAAASSPTPGTVTINFANNNFQITHQKTILIDAADPVTGVPLAAAALPPTARALVSTGNLEAYGWGSQSLTDPIQGCTQNGCLEWSARDFFVSLAVPNLIAEIENVYFSDLHCGSVPPGTTPSATNTNNLLTTPLPLTWSNGTTWEQAGVMSYPSAATGYPSELQPGMVIQGNARQRTLDVINGAKTSLLVYNEEMDDPETIAALVAKSEQLGPGNLKVMMTMNDSWWPAWFALNKAGAQIRLTQANTSQNSTQLYIHGKVLIADQTNVFLGSENISYESLNYNRELGLLITSRRNPSDRWLESVQAVQTVANTFYSDFNHPDYLDWQVTPLPEQKTRATRSQENSDFPMLCGPIPPLP